MHKRIVSVLFAILILALLNLASTSYAQETKTLESIADTCVTNLEQHACNATEPSLQVGHFYVQAWITYLLFDLSEIPAGATIDSVILMLKSKTYAIEHSRLISAFSCSADWVETEITWDSKPLLDKPIGTRMIDLIEEWYSWEHSYLTNAAEEAFNGGENLSVALKTDVTGLVWFYSRESDYAPKLEVTYTVETIPPTLRNIKIQPQRPQPEQNVTISCSITDNESGVKEVSLYYSTDGGLNWIKVQMSLVTDSVYRATVPGQIENTAVDYYMEAFDNAGNCKQSSQQSYNVRTDEEQNALGLSEIPLWAVITVVFTVIGLGAITIFYFVRKRQQS